MSLNHMTENAAIAGTDEGRSTANLVYILYIVGFFTGFTALAGYFVAKFNEGNASGPYKTHLVYQQKLFVRGLVICGVAFLTSIVASIVSVFTLGLGFIFYLLPIGVSAWFLVAMIAGIVKGMSALGRREPVPGT
jgi:uncharacterized membrane protein